MSSRTTLTVSKAAARRFHTARSLNGMEKSAFLELLVRALDVLTPEQRMSVQLPKSEASAPPSSGDRTECDDSAPAKQARTHRLPQARRKAG